MNTSNLQQVYMSILQQKKNRKEGQTRGVQKSLPGSVILHDDFAYQLIQKLDFLHLSCNCKSNVTTSFYLAVYFSASTMCADTRTMPVKPSPSESALVFHGSDI